MLMSSPVLAQEDGQCTSPQATEHLQSGFEAQQSRETDAALQAYQACLSIEPDRVSCLYEIGWAYWSRSEWGRVASSLEKVQAVPPDHEVIDTWLPQAADRRDNPERYSQGIRAPIGTQSETGGLRLKLFARFQNYNITPSADGDNVDSWIFSPKSARFLEDGSRVYINSLEGFQTVIYDPTTLTRVGRIQHTFDAAPAPLFQDESTVFDYRYNRTSPSGDPNQFSGKPVESATIHSDLYLWVPYYRRDFDNGSTSPSAVSFIDTQSNTIVRMMPTGPIPRYVAISTDNKWAATVHWGDNTIGIIDIPSGDPSQLRYLDERLVVESILPQQGLAGSNRDASCGFCLRGTVFTPNSESLLVSRMGGGGLADFDVESWAYQGTLTGEPPTPRHLVISPDGK